MCALVRLLFGLLFLASFGCGGGEPASSSAGSSSSAPVRPPKAPPESSKEELTGKAVAAADAKYKAVCATCHGQSGKGDAPAAANFPVKPRDYSDKEWQASVTDDYLAEAIVGGGVAVGKSPLMPASPDLKDKPEILAALVAKIRGFAAE